MAKVAKWIARHDARHRFGVSLIVAGTVWWALKGRLQPSTQTIATWDAFAVCVLVLAWLTIITTPPAKLRLRAQMQDFSRTLIFFFVVMAACAGLFAVGFLFFTNKGAQHRPYFSLHLL